MLFKALKFNYFFLMYKSVMVPSLISEAIAIDSERLGWGWMDSPMS